MAVAVPVAEATRRFTSQPRQLLIAGEWVDAADGETFETIDPGTGQGLTHVAHGKAEDIDRAVRAARRALEGPWSALTPSERGRAIHRLGDLIAENLEELAELDSLDNGKAKAVAAAADVPLAADLFWYMAGWATKLRGSTRHPVAALPAGPGVPRLHDQGASRRRRADHSLELPAADGRLEGRAGPRDGLHDRPQAGRADAAERPASRRAGARGRDPAGRPERRHGLR